MHTTRLLSSTSILFPRTTFDRVSQFLQCFDVSAAHDVRKGSLVDLVVMLESGTRPSSCPMPRSSWSCSRRRPAHSNRLLDKRQLPVIEIALDQRYPIASER